MLPLRTPSAKRYGMQLSGGSRCEKRVNDVLSEVFKPPNANPADKTSNEAHPVKSAGTSSVLRVSRAHRSIRIQNQIRQAAETSGSNSAMKRPRPGQMNHSQNTRYPE